MALTGDFFVLCVAAAAESRAAAVKVQGRASLTARGRVVLEAATQTYATSLADALDTVLTEADQQHLYALVRHLLAARTAGQGMGDRP
jgi:hypothetical protein